MDEVERSGAVIPVRYRRLEREDFGLEAASKQDAIRKARLAAGRRISAAFTGRRIPPSLASDAVARNRQSRAGRIEGQIRRAIEELRQDDALLAHLSAEMEVNFETGVGFLETIDGMERMLRAIKAMRLGSSGIAPIKGMKLTGQKFLFQRLDEAYRDVLDADPSDGLKKPYDNFHGPFVTFIRAAFSLADMPEMSNSAMTRALQRAGFGTKDKD